MANNDRRQEKADQKNLEIEDERRKGDRRRDIRVPVNIWVEEYQGDDVYFQQAGNLSVGGVFFERTIPHPIGTKVGLRFSIPGSEGVIETTGEVVSVPSDEDFGAGIRFIDLDPVEEQIIREYIDKQLS